jgi:hypothetical protein
MEPLDRAKVLEEARQLRGELERLRDQLSAAIIKSQTTRERLRLQRQAAMSRGDEVSRQRG